MAAGTYDPLEVLHVAELAALWKVHENTVRKLIASRELESVQLGRRRVVPRVAAEEYMRRHSSEGPA